VLFLLFFLFVPTLSPLFFFTAQKKRHPLQGGHRLKTTVNFQQIKPGSNQADNSPLKNPGKPPKVGTACCKWQPTVLKIIVL